MPETARAPAPARGERAHLERQAFELLGESLEIRGAGRERLAVIERDEAIGCQAEAPMKLGPLEACRDPSHDERSSPVARELGRGDGQDNDKQLARHKLPGVYGCL